MEKERAAIAARTTMGEMNLQRTLGADQVGVRSVTAQKQTDERVDNTRMCVWGGGGCG